jgi:tetratricopeptide (TPR) repeat protein
VSTRRLIVLAAFFGILASSFVRAADVNPRDLERGCHDYTATAASQIAACTPLIPLYGDKIETIGIKALAHLARATAYARSGDQARAAADYREAIRLDTIPIEAGSMEALLYNDRCWVRAIAMIELDLALADCNAAIRLRPNFTAALDSRAFLHLKRGDYKEALADYDAALKDSPMDAYSIFGRGVAKLRSGDMAGGNADIEAAVALERGLREEMAAYGVMP